MSQPEHRRTERKPIHLHASVTPLDDGTPIPVETLNLSKRGTLIESKDKLLPEEVCTFKIVTADARVVQVQGRVAWVTRQDNGLYRAGVSFRNLSVDEEYWLELAIARNHSQS